MKHLLPAVLLVSCVTFGRSGTAVEMIPAERLADWRPGVTVGVPGGIPTNRTHVIDVTKSPYRADNTGVTDAQPAIQKAITVFVVDGALQCEIKHCYLGQRKSAAGPNGGGLLMGVSAFCLVEDNVLAETFPDMEIDNSSGNVFACNFCDDKSVQGGLLGCSINSNHGGHGSHNLYEGNVAPRFQCDGYHGSASHDTAFSELVPRNIKQG